MRLKRRCFKQKNMKKSKELLIKICFLQGSESRYADEGVVGNDSKLRDSHGSG